LLLHGKRRRWLITAVLSGLALAALFPFGRLVATVRLLAVIRHVAAGEIGRSPAVKEDTIIRRLGALKRVGITYRPADANPTSAVILVHGVSELGCYHPRLVSLSRALAGAGFLVLTPDITLFREFRIYPPPLDEISFWLNEVHNVDGGRELRRVGLAGISFSGTLSLIAASQPQNRDATAYVVGIGSFDDLIRCSAGWFAAGPITVGEGYHPTRFYARWIMMLAAVDMLEAGEDREFIQVVLRNLLLQKEVPSIPGRVTEEGRRWCRLALMREDQEDPTLARRIEQHVSALLYPGLATQQPAAEIRCPVFLAHGAYDDLVPPEESRRLREKIVQARSYLVISPFLTHTHPMEKSLDWRQQAGAALDLFGFFYALSGAM
jgi:pimeloyl-ACP methyl ester carboxylesterase